MTFGNWNFIEGLTDEELIFPNIKNQRVPNDVDNYKNIQVVSDDMMVFLRKIVPFELLAKDKSGLTRESTQNVLNRSFEFITDTLKNTDVKMYIPCLDPIRQPGINPNDEKKSTDTKRAAHPPKNEPLFLELLPGETTFFDLHKPFPAPNTNIIFRTPAARREFYHIITQHFMSPLFASKIPDGKCVILCGGYDLHTNTNLPPVVISNDGISVEDHLAFPSCREGDLYAIWAVRRYKGNFVVRSGDADLLFILLGAMSHILSEDKDRQCWFVTPRCAGKAERPVSRREIELLNHKNEMLSDALSSGASAQSIFLSIGTMPSASNLRLKTQRVYKGPANVGKRQRVPGSMGDIALACLEPPPQVATPSSSQDQTPIPSEDNIEEVTTLMRSQHRWLDRYVDMTALYNAINTEATSQLVHHGIEIYSPVELMISAFILISKSNDYIDCSNFVKGVGADDIWRTFLSHQRELCDLVKIGIGPDRITKKNTKYVAVDVNTMLTFIELCYRTVASKRKNPEASYKVLKAKQPPLNVTQSVAGQLAWTLHYWLNGTIRSARIEDGLMLSSTGLSIYGFGPNGWTTDVEISPKVICPSLIDNQS